MKKRIGLDLDGTILDSRYRHQIVLYDILCESEHQVTFESLNDYVAFKSSGKNTISYLSEKNIPNSRSISDLWVNRIELNQYLSYDILYPDVTPILAKLSSVFEVYIVTARKNKNGLLHQVAELGISKFISDTIIVEHATNTGRNKFNATKNLGISHVIGDTEVDFEWAYLLGVTFSAVNYGFRSNEWWQKRDIVSHSSFTSATMHL